MLVILLVRFWTLPAKKTPKIQIVIDTVSLKENVFRLFGLGFFLQIYFLDWYTS